MRSVSAFSTFAGAALIASLGAFTGAHAELAPRAPADLSVPSGQEITFLEAFVDHSPSGRTARFRFVAPQLKAQLEASGYVALEADLAHLCEAFALERIAAPLPKLIVISMAEAPIEFGSFDPDVMQVFEGYKPAGESCAWEAF